jgi:glycyl-tRNA synthetase beta chain
VFHEKLGTVADKVDRVAKLARWLVESGVVKDANPDHAEQAARLAKADLVTGMVGEFPELQGVMGGYYAHAEGLPHDVAEAIRDHYKPVGQGDDVPTAPVTVAVSLADKLDSLVAFFGAQERPTGSSDPFALRRAALGLIRLSVTNNLRLPLVAAREEALDGVIVTVAARANDEANSALREAVYGLMLPEARFEEPAILSSDQAESWRGHRIAQYFMMYAPMLDAFIIERLKVQQREAGVRHDLIDAVFALGGEDDLVRLLARVKALQAFVSTEDGANLLAGYKRAANILRKEEWPGTGEAKPLSYTPEPAESALIAGLDTAESAAESAVNDENFEAAMAALASLRGPIDAFFDSVTVNDVSPEKREARLDLLARIRRAVHRVADFSKIEG